MSENHSAADEQEEQRSPTHTEQFNPPVEIISDPPGYRSKSWPNIVEVKYGVPRGCDVKLEPRYGGDITTNPAFIRISDDDPHNRSLQENPEQDNG